MTSERDIERLLDRWFTERPTQVPDRVLDQVAGRIGRQSQRPAWLIPWRDSHVNPYLKYAAALAAVVIVAAVGFAVFRSPSGSNVGGVESPAPSPSAPASTSPSAPASPPRAPSSTPVFPTYPPQGDGSGPMSAGNQTTLRFLPGTTFSVPAGWVNELDNGLQFGLYPDTAANKSEYELTRQIAQNVLMTSLVANNMFAICDATGLFQGSTAAEVIDGIVANEALSTTEPVDVTIGGLSGRQVDVRLDPAWTGSCVVVSEDDPPTRDYGGGNRFIMLDRPGQGPIGIAIGAMHSADFEAFLAEAMPIVESFQFDLGPQASPS